MTEEIDPTIAAHERAALEHQACAEFHAEAALCHKSKEHDDAKANAKSAMRSCCSASEHSALACAGSDENA